MSGMLLDICQFANSHLKLLWKCLCNHLEDGDLDLKTVSIEIHSHPLPVINGFRTK